MRLINGSDWLELSRASFPSDTAGGISDPDILLNVSYRVTGVAGGDQAWVARSEWDAFLSQLASMELQRREGVLSGASPEEFRLRFYVFDTAGHTAIQGLLARREGTNPEHHGVQVSFHLPFEPDQLRAVLEEFRDYTRMSSDRS